MGKDGIEDRDGLFVVVEGDSEGAEGGEEGSEDGEACDGRFLRSSMVDFGDGKVFEGSWHDVGEEG